MSGKMRSHYAMQRIVDKFFVSCKEKGLTDYQSKELWRQIESFAGYSSAKHTVHRLHCFLTRLRFLKLTTRLSFMASVLNNGGGFYSPAVYIEESKRLGLKIELPSINESEKEYVGKGKASVSV